MGTRNLTCVFIGGEYKVAQYGQWDGYPRGQGATILSFLSDAKQRRQLKQKVGQCYFATDAEIDAAWAAAGSTDGLATMEMAKKLKGTHPQFSRDTAACVLGLVAGLKKGQRFPVENSIEFASDSLFCEWAYVIDFDKGTFEVYKGWNTGCLCKAERFSSLTKKLKKGEEEKENYYYPVRLVRAYPLSKLPTNEQFLDELAEISKYPDDEKD